MSEHQTNSNKYSAADIQRYLDGEMSADEMHAVETAALDDPFLADAIEGYENAKRTGTKENISGHLQQLHRKLEQRVKKPAEVVPIYQAGWWKISAAAAVLVIISVAAYNNWMKPGKTSEPILAVTERGSSDTSVRPNVSERNGGNPIEVDPPQKQESATSHSAPPAPSQADQSAQRPRKLSNDAPGSLANSKKAETSEAEKQNNSSLPAYSGAEVPKQAPASLPTIADKEKNDERKDVAAPKLEEFARKNNQLAAQLNTFSGRVLDHNNNPLPYANVQIMQNKANVVTDQSGNFNFSAPDSIVDVQVALVGFEQRNFRLQNNIGSNNLVMQPNKESLQEVVVTGYGTQRKRSTDKITGKVQDAQPVIGWMDYEKYLTISKKPPASNPLLKGESVISFVVKKTGGLSDFKVEKSLSADHDKEAIRLIQEGPDWKPVSGRSARVTVIVKF